MEGLFSTIENKLTIESDLDMKLLEQYNVKFIKKSLYGKFYPACIGDGLANFLDDFTNMSSIENGLQKIDLFLNNGNLEVTDDEDTISTDSYYAIIDNNNVDIFSSYTNPPVSHQTIPNQDFRDILQMWLDFVRS